MKLKVKDLIMASPSLNNLCNCRGLKGTVTMKLVHNKRMIADGLKDYDEARTKVCEKYCIKDKNGKPIIKKDSYQFAPSIQPLFNKENQELMDEDIDVNINKVNFTDLEDSGMSANDIINLEFMLNFDDKEMN